VLHTDLSFPLGRPYFEIPPYYISLLILSPKNSLTISQNLLDIFFLMNDESPRTFS
jgi:hypothetical protein